MNNIPQTVISQTCTFQTQRLEVKPWKDFVHSSEAMQTFAELAVQMLSPEVTKDLPDDWQTIETKDDANAWAKERDEESSFLVVLEKTSQTMIGLLFLYESEVGEQRAGEQQAGEQQTGGPLVELRLGYLLAQKYWGKGYASELIQGLVAWCHSKPAIQAMIGGVATNNLASIRVLEKNGFKALPTEMKDTLLFKYQFATPKS